MWKFLSIILTGLSLISCNPDQSNKEPEQKTEEVANVENDPQWAKNFLDSANTNFSQQIAAGDSVGLASQYWPDAELLFDNMEPIKGDDILRTWGSTIRSGVKEMKCTTTDIKQCPNLLIETGGYEILDGNKVLIDKGKFVVVWEKRNGEWKLYRDIGSTSMPAK